MPDGLTAGDRVVVTGGHGFIGRHVVGALADAGFATVAVAYPDGEVLDIPGESAVVDLTDARAVEALLEGADAVVHLAARAGGVQFQQGTSGDVFRTNRAVTDNVLAACVAGGVRRVFIASSAVVYRSGDGPLTERHPVLGIEDHPSPYAWSKITDEVVASWVDEVEVVIGRFGNVYGPGAPFEGSRSTVVHALIQRASQLSPGEALTVWGDGTAVRSFVFVDDVARAVVLILTSGESGTAYNVDSGEPLSVGRLAEVVRAAVAPETRLEFDATKPSGPISRVPAIDRLRGLGYEPLVGIVDGVRRTVEWFEGLPTE